MGADQTPFLIRTAQLADADPLSKMMVRSWRESYSDIIAANKLNEICDVWLVPEKFVERIRRVNACNLIAEVAGEIVGHTCVLPQRKDSLLVAYLYVLNSHARRGVGTTLLNSAIASFPGAAHVELGVFDGNQPAIDFYKDFGFYEAGPEPVSTGEPASIKMTMAL